jgi:hypothetical protein
MVLPITRRPSLEIESFRSIYAIRGGFEMKIAEMHGNLGEVESKGPLLPLRFACLSKIEAVAATSVSILLKMSSRREPGSMGGQDQIRNFVKDFSANVGLRTW